MRTELVQLSAVAGGTPPDAWLMSTTSWYAVIFRPGMSSVASPMLPVTVSQLRGSAGPVVGGLALIIATAMFPLVMWNPMPPAPIVTSVTPM